MSHAVAIAGAAGRMGKTLIQEVVAAADCHLSGASEAPGNSAIGQDAGRLCGLDDLDVQISADVAELFRGSDAAIDFTSPANTNTLAPLAAQENVALVVGTTGFEEALPHALVSAAKHIPLVWSPNMSIGINVLLALAADAAKRLGADYEIEIVEAHHRHKVDAPSGTARRIAEVIAEATSEAGSLDSRACYGRRSLGTEARTDSRQRSEIGIHSVRGGDIVGDHTAFFCGEGERLELTHRASSRQTFARGALRALRWVVGKPPGLYSMRDVLGL